jgi:hypothetical protein
MIDVEGNLNSLSLMVQRQVLELVALIGMPRVDFC